ncbi:hypothetical protein [Streptomyces sp. NBC_01803]|nr:hypothetical protein [Streptomyces sp. NBC_01803]WSA47231.1 hypothetical protein OIE51_25450 [Streptomyces sp. NBC_01803]
MTPRTPPVPVLFPLAAVIAPGPAGRSAARPDIGHSFAHAIG